MDKVQKQKVQREIIARHIQAEGITPYAYAVHRLNTYPQYLYRWINNRLLTPHELITLATGNDAAHKLAQDLFMGMYGLQITRNGQ